MKFNIMVTILNKMDQWNLVDKKAFTSVLNDMNKTELRALYDLYSTNSRSYTKEKYIAKLRKLYDKEIVSLEVPFRVLLGAKLHNKDILLWGNKSNNPNVEDITRLTKKYLKVVVDNLEDKISTSKGICNLRVDVIKALSKNNLFKNKLNRKLSKNKAFLQAIESTVSISAFEREHRNVQGSGIEKVLNYYYDQEKKKQYKIDLKIDWIRDKPPNPYYNLTIEQCLDILRKYDVAPGANPRKTLLEYDNILGGVPDIDIEGENTTHLDLLVYAAYNKVSLEYIVHYKSLTFDRLKNTVLKAIDIPHKEEVFHEDEHVYEEMSVISLEDYYSIYTRLGGITEILTTGEQAFFIKNGMLYNAERIETRYKRLIKSMDYRFIYDVITDFYKYTFPEYNVSSYKDVIVRDVFSNYEDVIRDVFINRLIVAGIYENLGIMIPGDDTIKGWMTNNIQYYYNAWKIRRNVKNYMYIPEPLTRENAKNREILDKYTDREILTTLRCIINYKSRKNFIDLLTGDDKFFFISYERNSVNDKTVLFTDVKDSDIFMVAYGHPLGEYHCFEMDELITAFRVINEGESEETDRIGNFEVSRSDFSSFKSFLFENPAGGKFNEKEIEDLSALLKYAPLEINLDRIREKINLGMLYTTRLEGFSKVLYDKFASFSKSERRFIGEFLYQVFLTGMYCRRWKGEGHPWPIKKRSTKIDFDPSLNISNSIMKIKESLKNVSDDIKNFLVGQEDPNLKKEKDRLHYEVDGIAVPREIQSDDWRGGLMSVDAPLMILNPDISIGYILETVSTEQYCIKIASTQFVGTAVYYMLLFFKEDIPGFNPKLVASIQ